VAYYVFIGFYSDVFRCFKIGGFKVFVPYHGGYYFIGVVGDFKAIARSFVDPALDMGSFLNVTDPASWGAI
jgi:hypothetical protein